MLRVLNYWDVEEQGFGQGLRQKSMSWVDFPSVKPYFLPGRGNLVRQDCALWVLC